MKLKIIFFVGCLLIQQNDVFAGGKTNTFSRLCGGALRLLSKLSGQNGQELEAPLKPRNTIQKIEDIQTLLIIVAMDVEYDAIKKEADKTKSHILNADLGIEVLEISVGKRKILIGKSGVGPVNGALLAVLADQKFKLDGILLLGVGGSLDKKLNVGDLVVSNRIIQHDSVFTGDTEELMAPGELYLSLAPKDRPSPSMPSSSVLSDFLMNIAQKKGHRAFAGTVLSGNEFAARVDRKREIAAFDPESLLVDMEAAGIAQVSRRLNIPMSAAKTVADRAEPDGQIGDDYKTFLGAASEHAGDIFREILKHFRDAP